MRRLPRPVSSQPMRAARLKLNGHADVAQLVEHFTRDERGTRFESGRRFQAVFPANPDVACSQFLNTVSCRDDHWRPAGFASSPSSSRFQSGRSLALVANMPRWIRLVHADLRAPVRCGTLGSSRHRRCRTRYAPSGACFDMRAVGRRSGLGAARGAARCGATWPRDTRCSGSPAGIGRGCRGAPDGRQAGSAGTRSNGCGCFSQLGFASRGRLAESPSACAPSLCSCRRARAPPGTAPAVWRQLADAVVAEPRHDVVHPGGACRSRAWGRRGLPDSMSTAVGLHELSERHIVGDGGVAELFAADAIRLELDRVSLAIETSASARPPSRQRSSHLPSQCLGLARRCAQPAAGCRPPSGQALWRLGVAT